MEQVAKTLSLTTPYCLFPTPDFAKGKRCRDFSRDL